MTGPSEPEPLYAERVITAACTAGARALYEQNVVAAGADPTDAPSYDDLPREVQHALVNAAIPIVWAGINALPDGRWAIWQQGYDAAKGAAGPEEYFYEKPVEVENPYPPPEFDITEITGG
jgi:hypothetical protein